MAIRNVPQTLTPAELAKEIKEIALIRQTASGGVGEQVENVYHALHARGIEKVSPTEFTEAVNILASLGEIIIKAYAHSTETAGPELKIHCQIWV